MNYKQTAEAYVRSQLPELMELSFGCEVDVKYTNVNPRKVATGVFEIGDGKDLVYLASNVGGEGEMVYVKRYEPSDNFIQKIIGHPIELNHWLRVLRVFGTIKISGSGTRLLVEVYDAPHFEGSNYKEIVFNLTTGQPVSEADYQTICNILGI